MKIGLVGFPGSGKTTVFCALTGLSAETGASGRSKSHLGTVKVPDRRVEDLAAKFNPKKKVYAEIVFSDVGAGAGAASSQGLDRGTLNAMREVDALCQVVRAFEDPANPLPLDPLREATDLEVETILADQEIVEKRLERIKKEKGKPEELPILERVLAHLEASKPIRTLALSEQEAALVVGYRFLSQKPLLLVLNVDEGKIAAPPPADFEKFARERGLGLVVLSARVESDIALMPPEEQKEFLASLGVESTAKDRFIRAAFALLDLISFFTYGEDECRAWPIRKGTTAHRAAGKIHSDIERGFIRAEVVRVEDLLVLGSDAKCREAGKLRLEGKEYVMQDGDGVMFRFNV